MKPTTILTLDTTNASMLSVSLHIQGTEYTKHEDTGLRKSVRLLPLCTEILYEHHLSWADLTDIRVVNKEGSITGLRVGFTVANALGFLLGISVNGMPAMKKHPSTVRYANLS